VFGAALTAPGAPVPPDTVPAPTGPAPQVAFLRADPTGKVWVQVLTYQKQKQTRSRSVVENGQRVVKQEVVEVMVPTYSRKQLGDVGAKFTTADGSELTADDALRRIKDGTAVLVSADGKPVQKAWLKAAGPDAIVISAEWLASGTIQNTSPQPPPTAAPRLVLLAADMEGKVRLAYNPNVGGNVGGVYYGNGNIVMARQLGGVQQVIIQDNAGFAPPAPNAPAGAAPTKPLDEVKFEAYDLTGKAVPKDEALKRLKAGGMVLIAGDNRLPADEYLGLFKGDLLVLVSAELIGVPGAAGSKPITPGQPAALPAVRGGVIAPAIAPAAPAIQIKPAVIGPVIAPANKPAIAVPAKPVQANPGAAKPAEKPPVKD
jgi:hypothetical protein